MLARVCPTRTILLRLARRPACRAAAAARVCGRRSRKVTVTTGPARVRVGQLGAGPSESDVWVPLQCSGPALTRMPLGPRRHCNLNDT